MPTIVVDEGLPRSIFLHGPPPHREGIVLLGNVCQYLMFYISLPIPPFDDVHVGAVAS